MLVLTTVPRCSNPGAWMFRDSSNVARNPQDFIGRGSVAVIRLRHYLECHSLCIPEIEGMRSLRPEVAIERAVLNRFADVLRFDCVFTFEVGESTTHLQDSIVSASRQSKPRDRVF